MKKNQLAGFKVLKSAGGADLSLKLITRGEGHFLVLFTRYFLGIPLQHRRYLFSQQEAAERVYGRLAQNRPRGFLGLF